MRCKYKVRWFYSKGAFLILFWIGILFFVVTSTIDFLPSIKHQAFTNKPLFWLLYGLIFVLSVLVGPLTGWLADAKYGNYKVVRFGIFLMFLGTIFNCSFFVIKPFVDYSILFNVFVEFVIQKNWKSYW